MAFEHGSVDLGIPNPFKFEGLVRSIRGLITVLLGIYLLLKVPELVKGHSLHAWIYLGIGVSLLAAGLFVLGKGGAQLMRFFVGRSAPASLAKNINKDEHGWANKEATEGYLRCKDSSELVNMLEAQKNTMFGEPKEWVDRLIHSIFPKLTFLPDPLRNVAQRLTAALTLTLITLICFTFTWFISSAGLIGDAGVFVIQTFSLLLLLYVLKVWHWAGKGVTRKLGKYQTGVTHGMLARRVMLAIVVPVLIGLTYSKQVIPAIERSKLNIYELAAQIAGFGVSGHLWAVLFLSVVSCGLMLLLIRMRSVLTNPVTEVSSERGKNWQKDVNGAKEIYNQIKNVVMVNRWQLKVPNRQYRHHEEDNIGDKSFSFNLLEETQPIYEHVQYPKNYNMGRIVATVIGQLLLLAASVLLVILAVRIAELTTIFNTGHKEELLSSIQGVWSLFFVMVLLGVFGRLVANLSYFFWAEIPFQSLLIYCRGEGTYNRQTTRSGKAIHDSKESEAVVTRVSVNPVVLVSRLFSVTFAGSGVKNLEWPRQVLEMHKDDTELEAIISDMDNFFESRSTHEGISNVDMAQQVQKQGAYVEQLVKPTGHNLLSDDLTNTTSAEDSLNEVPTT